MQLSESVLWLPLQALPAQPLHTQACTGHPLCKHHWHNSFPSTLPQDTSPDPVSAVCDTCAGIFYPYASARKAKCMHTPWIATTLCVQVPAPLPLTIAKQAVCSHYLVWTCKSLALPVGWQCPNSLVQKLAPHNRKYNSPHVNMALYCTHVAPNASQHAVDAQSCLFMACKKPWPCRICGSVMLL